MTKRPRTHALAGVTYAEPHEVVLVEPDGRESYSSELGVGPAQAAANWVAYTQVFEASRVLGGTVVIRRLT